jgi:hypothetical protein
VVGIFVLAKKWRRGGITASLTLGRSANVSVGASPVAPHGTRPSTPSAISQSAREENASSSNAPSQNGVTSSEIKPLNTSHPLGLGQTENRSAEREQ